MRAILTNGRQFIIKVGYLTDYKYKKEYDQYGREICIRWKEYSTLVTITEFFPQETMEKIGEPCAPSLVVNSPLL